MRGRGKGERRKSGRGWLGGSTSGELLWLPESTSGGGGAMPAKGGDKQRQVRVVPP